MSERIRVAVLGAAGRMGSTVVAAVEAAPDLELVAALDAGADLQAVVDAGAQVAVDFTVPSATEGNVHALVDAGVHLVVGTTGWTDESLARVRDHLADRPGVGVVVAPNFALGAVLAMAFAARAARWFESVEVIELHHPDKVDAPSGTARHTASAIAAARAAAGLRTRCPTRRRRRSTGPAGRTSTVSACTPCGCAGWSRTRRSCWATPASSSPSGTTRSTG